MPRAFMKEGQRQRGEIHDPHTVVDRRKGDVKASQDFRKKEFAPPPFHAAGRTDASDETLSGILQRREAPRQRARRRPVAGGRWGVSDRVMGPNRIVFLDEAREAPLLRGQRGGGRARGVLLEDAVKLLVGAVVPGAPRPTARREYPESQPEYG